MKKSIRKPLIWQDFESLCKILWGEIWGISDKIKKNGRLGQPQAGVDVYGVPKGKIKYSAIQCKGKDDYSDAVITKKEIDTEIKNAKLFKPELETFIFATTANKDSVIEQYVREKDMESRADGGFEILIYCWEDIADLIELNRETFNYYVLNNQFKSNYELEVTFVDNSTELIVQPKFNKTITSYELQLKEIDNLKRLSNRDFIIPNFQPFPIIKNVNNSWSTVSIRIKNTGSEVIEDYKLFIYPEQNKFRDISGFFGGFSESISYYKHSPLYVYEEEKYALYKPLENTPLIQKDSRNFEIHFLTHMDQYEFKIHYELLARNFSQEGDLIVKVEPQYKIEDKVIWVNNEYELREPEIEIGDIMTEGGLI